MRLIGLWALMVVVVAGAQEPQVPKVVPVPPLPARKPRVAAEPTSPAAQTVEDLRTHVVLHLPPGWNVSRKDGELSTFRLDARSAPRRSQLRLAVGLAFNPFPLSTFAGAMIYLSTVPGTSEGACAAETTLPPESPLPGVTVGDVKFARGKDEHGHICTEARDVTYTALRGGSCVRFDLVVNSFCGGEVSGAEDLTEDQLGSLVKRLEDVLATVEFRGK